jgi:hypothetical protein
MIYKSLHVRKPHRISISKAVILLCGHIDFISDRVPYGRGACNFAKIRTRGGDGLLWLACERFEPAPGSRPSPGAPPHMHRSKPQ